MDSPTCGKGLAENAALPAKLGQLIDSLAEVLETHLGALDLSDPSSQAERHAYTKLAADHREIAARLRANAAEMAGYRDLPMARHDPKAMAEPKVAQVFEAYVMAENELLELLAKLVDRDRAMLASMRGPG